MMTTDEYETAMRALTKLQAAPPYERVYGWRQVLRRAWDAGFDAGYTARDRDMHISDRITEREAVRPAESKESTDV
jgi:hypothetical protein